MNDFENKVKKEIRGKIYSDKATRCIYSQDASIYEVIPQYVVIPETKEDVRILLQLANEYKLPITPRGAATGITGACLGSGVVIDLSLFFNRILDINPTKEIAVVEAGVIQDDLNSALQPFGFRLGPNTSTGNRATVGGMAGNNAAGSHSLLYGQMSDHIHAITGFIQSGEEIEFRPIQIDELSLIENTALLAISSKLYKIAKRYKEEIASHFPTIKRRVSGYNLDALLGNIIHFPRLLSGSEGSLAVTTELELKITRPLPYTKMVLLFFDNFIEASKTILSILEWKPIALELIDREILHAGKKLAKMQKDLQWLVGDPAAIYVVEFGSSDPQELENTVQKFVRKIPLPQASIRVIDHSEEKKSIWAVRKAGLELLLSKRSFSRALAFIEDIVIPPESLPQFFTDFFDLLKKHKKNASLYGHVGEGCLHIRPYVDLRSKDELETMIALIHQTKELVKKYHGAMSGEHGDGRIRSFLNKELFTPALYEAMVEVKKAFDPLFLLNPHMIVEGEAVDKFLRLSPTRQPETIETKLDFEKEGGFSLAVDLCNGNGLCRKKEGVMCPSFQATGREYDSTRGRANVLRSLLYGEITPKNLAHPSVHDVLDLCLMCKGCKRECPSLVDMAKMKVEALYHWNQKHGMSFRDRFFANLPLASKMSSLFPKISNLLIGGSLGKYILRKLQVTDSRSLPKVASFRFSHWLRDYNQEKYPEKVALFIDTFTEFYEPEIGIAVVKLCNLLGVEVLTAPWNCCGRTLLSKGCIDEAKEYAEKALLALKPLLLQNIPLLAIEPSCLSTLVDDYFSLKLSDTPPKVQSIEEFLYTKKEFFPSLSNTPPIYIHTHCHEKASTSSHPLEKLLLHFDLRFSTNQGGCCGMAGAFGYEKEHYDLSIAIGKKNLQSLENLPKETVVLASGFSCRTQIEHLHNRHAYHPAEFIYKTISNLK